MTTTHTETHHKQSFISKYIFSQDHKMIGKQYLVTTIIMAIVGGGLSVLMRIQLANPNHPIHFLEMILGKWAPGGILRPEYYLSMITLHATILVFFVLTAGLLGVFSNFLIPLQIGTRDMASPFLNMLSYWFFFLSCVVMLSSFFIQTNPAAAGWTVYPPLSVFEKAVPGSGLGMTLWLISMTLFVASTMMGGLNYITTVLTMRTKGMTLGRLPLTVWSFFIASILALLAFPPLVAGVLMMIFDHSFGTSFYIPTGLYIGGELMKGGGGSPILWQHLFWYLGHPEVYIILLPAVGITGDILSTMARKPLFAYKVTVGCLLAIGALSFIVWGHHMYMSGMNPVLGEIFVITTLVISMPTAIFMFNFLVTLWKGNIKFSNSMLFAIGFICLFLPGALTGSFLGSSTLDIQLHDTYFVVAHFHFTMALASLFGLFAGVYHWFPKMFGRMMNSTMGRIHFWITLIGVFLIFFPMFFMGTHGIPRRYYAFTEFQFIDKSFLNLNTFISYITYIVGAAQLVFIFNLFYSIFFGKKAEVNPWRATTLEWTLDNPGHGNWVGELPVVYRGPHEYSVPDAKEDFLPQNIPAGM